MEAKILKNVKFIALFSILCLLIVIPATFAGNNDTAILASDAIQNDDSIAVNSSAGDNLADEYYFDANAENDAGNGSYINPYKELTSTRVNDNSTIHLANGEYEWNSFKGVSNVSIIGQSAENTISPIPNIPSNSIIYISLLINVSNAFVISATLYDVYSIL